MNVINVYHPPCKYIIYICTLCNVIQTALYSVHVLFVGLSDSAFFTIMIVAKAIFTIFDSIMVVHFSLINETVIP